MKISHIHSRILVLPASDPLANSPENANAARPIVIVQIGTDDGIEGIAVSFYGGAPTRSLKAAVDDLGALTIGENPLRVESIIAKLRAAAGGSSPGGMFTLALSAIDIALWDIRGKALRQPLWKLLGGVRQRVTTYASGSLRRNLTLEEVVTAAGRLKEEAIDIGRRVENAGVGLFWLEDLTTHDDYAGLARVNAALATPICGGELVYGIVPFRHMIEARSVD